MHKMSLRQRRVQHSSIPSTQNNHKQYHQCEITDDTKTRKSSPCTQLTQLDRKLLLLITMGAILTRLYRIHEPPAVVFDELHFGGFMQNYLRREFAFDIHPWLGKLTLSFFAWLFGYRVDNDFQFTIGNLYPTNDYIIVRIVSALFGSFCIPIMYLICRELDYTIVTSFVTCLLSLFDLLLLTQSRLILLDSQLMFYLNLTILCSLRLWKSSQFYYGTKMYYGYLILTAITGALAMSVKWTAAVTPFLIIIVCLFGIGFLKRPTPIQDCFIAAIIAIIIYTIPWYIHFSVAIRSTPSAARVGDGIRHRLIGNESFITDSKKSYSFVKAFIHMHIKQYIANKNVKTRHLWESKWYEWPFNLRGIMYFTQASKEYSQQNPIFRLVYLIQNPAAAIWTVSSIIAFIPFGLVVIRYRQLIVSKEMKQVFEKGIFLFSGYIFNLIPYMFVERCYFLYHYLPALTYAQLMVGLFLNWMPKKIRWIMAIWIVITIIASFIYWSPWVYCNFIHFNEFQKRQWMPRWN